MKRGIEFQVTGRAYLVLALWILVVPIRWAAAALTAACVHELGHLAALRLWGVKVFEIEIDIFGAKIETAPMDNGQELACALAGPLAGLALCALWKWLPSLSIWALTQSVFNLLPIYPLDGGRAWRAGRKIWLQRREIRSTIEPIEPIEKKY